MDQLSDVSHRADWKRLGEDNLSNNYGEFRHYHVEKVAYNAAQREIEKMDVSHIFFYISIISFIFLTFYLFQFSSGHCVYFQLP